MAKQKSEKMYEVHFVVEGLGSFPLDMLRYDCCFPDQSTDASLMARDDRRRRVSLVARSGNTSKPTAERWASFGWRVVSVS